ITRQALSNHLRELRRLGLLNTGRGFIDLTERTVHMLEGLPNRSFVFVKIEPRMRNKAYQQIKSLDIIQAFRVTGNVDVVMIVDRSKLDKVLKSLSTIDGVKETSAHLIIAPLVEG
ncbi:MAG: AsnC family transcriptional regulator, partial [Hadesarchaea archaeon]|nr:AsnC family transcriptional regulator [Hadesarchaea archaeon]